MKNNQFNLIVTSTAQQQKNDLMDEEIKSTTEFLDKISEIDSLPNLPYYNYQISFFREENNLDKRRSQNVRGTGHFVIFFSTNIHAFRSFCIFSVDWMNKLFDFSENIEGLICYIKRDYWYLHINVNDAAKASNLSTRYYALNHFVRGTIGITDQTQYIIGFQLHTAKFNASQNDLKARALSIPTFEECINRIVYGNSIDIQNQTARFDLSVINLYKRSRKERRLNPSYVDNVKNT